jgi:acetyltransferase-like isoleucine patch superfamily enzyme
MTEKEKAQAGYLYNANYDKEILDEINKCNNLCYEFNQLKPSEREAQAKLLARILGKVGENICVNAPFWCDYGSNTTVGDYFFTNHNCQILDGGKVTFGDHVFIAPNCLFTTAEHALDVEQRNEGLEVALPITIGNNVWIGDKACILGAVKIGEGSVIGANTVISKDVPAYSVVVGNPSRIIRTFKINK